MSRGDMEHLVPIEVRTLGGPVREHDPELIVKLRELGDQLQALAADERLVHRQDIETRTALRNLMSDISWLTDRVVHRHERRSAVRRA